MKPRFQFRLRTLFIVVTIFTVATGIGLTYYRKWVDDRERARWEHVRELIQNMGGGMTEGKPEP